MTRIRLQPLFAVLCAILPAAFLQAQPARVFVSAKTGSDLNSCAVTSPCRTFGQALLTAAAGGEIIVLDSGGYGPVTITKAITINVPGGIYAGVSVASGDGVAIAASAGDTVVLRGLTINGSGGSHGVNATSGGVVYIESCTVSGFSGAGINVATAGALFVTDTRSRSGLYGLEVGAGTLAAIDHCQFDNNTFDGLMTIDDSHVSIRNSVLSDNKNGMRTSTSGPLGDVNVDDCLIANNTTFGISASNNIVRISGSTLAGNGQALQQTGSNAIETYGNNQRRGNTNPDTGTITTVALE
jgi:Right handed beta helix region